MLAFRAIIAFVMAIVGSTIFDQTMFGKDIDKQMANSIEIQTANLTAQRVHTIDDKLSVLRAEYDSITNIKSHLQEGVNKNPFIIQTSVTNSTNSLVMSDGTIKKVNDPSVTRNQVANPKSAQIEANNKKLEAISVQ